MTAPTDDAQGAGWAKTPHAMLTAEARRVVIEDDLHARLVELIDRTTPEGRALVALLVMHQRRNALGWCAECLAPCRALKVIANSFHTAPEPTPWMPGGGVLIGKPLGEVPPTARDQS